MENNEYWLGCRKIGMLCTVGENVNGAAIRKNSMGLLQKLEI